jgi:hypothetical protein
MAASSSNLPVNFRLRNFPKKDLSVLRRLLLSGNEPSRIQKLQLGHEFRVVYPTPCQYTDHYDCYLLPLLQCLSPALPTAVLLRTPPL